MTATRWPEVKALAARALEATTGERAAILDAACAGDDALRREVESLLAAAAGPDSLPEVRAAIAAGARALADARGGDAHAERARLQAILDDRLGHQFEILSLLGHGGMGAVFLARERALERFVAIKVLRPDLAAAPAMRERFRREARVAARLSHPGILPMYTFGEVSGVWYFVMGYVRGQTLAERLRLEGRLPAAEAARILAELAEALDCAHRNGVVHRDIKPDNVLLDDATGRAVLADFGISKLVAEAWGADERLTAPGAVLGTPRYMSPEQARGDADVDERSDLYSLGAVGYAMLAGREPYDGASAAALAAARLTRDPLPLAQAAPGVPEELAAVVMRCLARDRALRWPDARALRAALARAGGEAVPALPEALRDLPGFAPYALLWALFWSGLALFGVRAAVDRALLALVAMLVPLGLALHVWNVGRHGLSRAELARVACWPPEWWGMWWPRRLRRPGDLWDRLPRTARLVRLVLSLFLALLPALILVRHRLDAPDAGGRALAARAAIGALEWGLVAVAALVVLGALGWAWRRGLTTSEAARVLLAGTTPSPAWRAPKVARLLAAGAGAVAAPERAGPAELRLAAEEVARALGGTVGVCAATLAPRLGAAVDALDRELATLARDAGAGELDRLSTQLGALEEAPAPEPDERRALRELVRGQLELVRRMRARHEVAARRRARLADLLRALWTALREAADEPEGGPGLARVAALCEEAERELGA